MISHKKKFITIFLIGITIFIHNCTSIKNTSSAKYEYINPERVQRYKDEVNLISKIKELREKDIIFIAYRSYSVGFIRANQKNSNSCSDCTPSHPIYLIWNEDNKGFIQKFDNCGYFFPLEIDSEIINFSNENFSIIKSEKIKLYQEDRKTFSNISHSTFKELLISKSGIEAYNHFDVYNLSTKPEKPNINAKYNNNLRVVELNELIEKQINRLNSLGLFKRDFSTCKMNNIN